MRRRARARHLVPAVLVLVTGCGAAPPVSRPAATDIGSGDLTSRSPADHRHRWAGGGAEGTAADPTPLRLLRAWDAARAAAYAEGSVRALRRLYAPGSAAGAADVAMLQEYVGRGLRVRGMAMQLLRLEVLHHTPGEWRLRVTDRLHGAVAVSGVERVPLPRDRASTHVVRLVRADDGRWLVAEAHPARARVAGPPGGGTVSGRARQRSGPRPSDGRR